MDMSAKMCGGLEGAQRLNPEKEIHPDKVWNGVRGWTCSHPSANGKAATPVHIGQAY